MVKGTEYTNIRWSRVDEYLEEIGFTTSGKRPEFIPEITFKDWFPRMCEYGFTAGKDFCSKISESTGGRPATDYNLTICCAKEICMIQKMEIGRTIRNYFFDLEEA